MNKAVSWTINRDGIDSREAARDAARRQGKSLGEWLHGVIAEHASELGVQDRETVAQDRIDAVTSKLERMSAHAAPLDDWQDPLAEATGSHSGLGRADDRARARTDRQAFASSRAEATATPPRSTTRRTMEASLEARRQRRKPAMFEDTEHLLEEAIDAMERRAMKAERRADDALTSFTKLMEKNESRRERERDSVESLSRKLSDLEARLSDRDHNPVKGALARLEARLETIARRSAAETSAWRHMAAPSAEPAELEPIRRLEEKLNTVLEAIVSRPDGSFRPVPAAPRSRAPEAPTRGRRFGDAINEIAKRQRALEGSATATAPSAEDESKGTVQRGASGFAAAPTPFAGMQGEIAALAAKIDDMRREVSRNKTASPPEPTANIDALRSEIAALARQLQELAPRGTIEALESQISNLTTRIEISRTQGTGEAVLQPVEILVDDLHQALSKIDPRQVIGSLESEVRAISDKIDQLTRNGLDAAGAQRIQEQMQEIRDLIAATAARPLAVEQIERQIAALTARLDQHVGGIDAAQDLSPGSNDIRTSVANPPGATAFQKIEDRLEVLAVKVDEAISFGGSRPNGDGTAASPDVTSLESLVRVLGEKIDAVRSSEADNRPLEALHEQMGLLASRFDRSETGLASLATLQRSMQELFAHLEETRTLVETSAACAAREVIRLAVDGGKSPAGVEPEHDAAVLKSLQDEADARTESTLGVVHETLGRVVDRLADMENDLAAAQGPANSSGREPETQQAAETKTSTVPAPSLSLDAIDLEPRGKKPKERGKKAAPAARNRPAEVDESAGRADFIAAARRAARAAQTDPSVVAVKRPRGPEDDKSTREDLISKSREYVSSHKRPVLLGLAAVFVVVGTMAIMERGPLGTEAVEMAATHTPTKIAQLAPRPPMKKTATSESVRPTGMPSKSAKSAVPAAKPGLDNDPIQTASIPNLPAFAAHGMAAPTPVPTLPAGLVAMAEKGDGAAAFSLGTRYAEGRGVPHDFALAAKWYAKAADRGLAPAQYRLASLYEKGLGVTQDKTRAKSLYLEAANAGNPRAMHNLAVLLADGGGKPDYENAATWFEKAAQYGVHDSQYNLAILLARGLGVKQSLVQSYEWFAVAAEQNDSDAAKKRDEVAARLDASELAVAKALAASYHPRSASHAATDVDPPAGGWDGASAQSPVNSARAKISSL